MTWRLLLIELRHWLRQPMVYIFFFLFALLSGLAVCTDAVVIGGELSNVKVNAPFMVFIYYSVLGIFGLLMVTAFVNASAIRDFTSNTAQMMFSTPLRKSDYLLSRFLGSTLIASLPMLGISLGVIVGSWLPFADPENIGPNNLTAHLQAYLYWSLPNILFASAVIFAVAINVRSTSAAFITTIVVIVVNGIASNMMDKLDDRTLGALLNPFGGNAFALISRYWTVEEKNTLCLPWGGLFLWNRSIWLGVATVVFIIGYMRFSFTERNSGKASREPAAGEAEPARMTLAIPAVSKHHGAGARWKQFYSSAATDTLSILKGTTFKVVAFLAIVFLIIGLANATELYENTIYPVTYHVIEVLDGSLTIFTAIIIGFYSGLLVWKERDSRFDEVRDATPVPLGSGLVAKYAALMSVLFTWLVLTALTGAAYQAMSGYGRIEPSVYVGRWVVPEMLSYGVLSALAILCHTLVSNKYVGYVVFLVTWLLGYIGWSWVDVSSHLIVFNSAPAIEYSDMNTYGTALVGWLWFKAYWWAVAAVLMVLALLFWVRGRETDIMMRLRIAGRRLKENKRFVVPAFALWIVLGAWGYYNTKVLNRIPSSDEQEEDQVYYERTYKKYEGILQPHYTDIRFTIDLVPAERKLHSVAEVTVRNKGDAPIDSLHLNMGGGGIEQDVEFPEAELVVDDERANYRIYKLPKPLMPGEDLRFKVIATHVEKGFENQPRVMQLNHNGTFFNNMDLIPTIGYTARGELQDKSDRKDHDLPPKERMARLSADSTQRMQTYLMPNSDWVNVSTVISTSPDQIAIAPGSLERTWDADGRKYFEYALDHASMNFYSFMSARYEVHREKLGEVDVEIYHHPTHAENVPRMANSIKKSLAYYTKNFGPYRHKQARIIEFPRYQTFAQAFPGTMPYSEAIGFIADLSDTTDIDMVFYVVAHEMGHQWWAHQVIGADMQGSTLLSESMAQYSALMVMEDEYGRGQMRKFLKLESDRYQRSRGSEELKEVPLMEVENQGYIHYNKASVILYCLRDFAGEDSLNKAFRSLVDTFAYAEPPYPTALDMYRELDKVVPDSLDYLLIDGFKKITLYNNRVEEATARMLPDSTYEVKLMVWGEKNYADSLGRETPAEMNDWMDISILRYPAVGRKADRSLNDVPLLHRRVRLKSGLNGFSLIVDGRPMQAVIDRDHLFIDRVMDDNMKKVDILQGP